MPTFFLNMAEETFEQYQVRLQLAAITTYILVCLIVPVKLWCRISIKGGNSKFGLDDVASVLAFLSTSGFFFVVMLGCGPYLGKHALIEVPMQGFITFLKRFFAAQLLYVTSLAAIKYSLLALYWRLFSTATRIPIIMTLLLVTAWCFSIIFLVIFTCDPVQSQWNVLITPNRPCISFKKVCYASSFPNVVTDVIVLLLPIPYVWKLRASLPKRLMLGGIFMLGCFVSIVSIIRLVIFTNLPLASKDFPYMLKEVAIWSIVEINVALICSCLPSIKPALHALGITHFFARIVRQPQTPTPQVHGNSDGNDGLDVSFDLRGPCRTFAKPPGLFSLFTNLTNMSRLDGEEDSHAMIEIPAIIRGKNETNIDVRGHLSDTEDESASTNPPDINICQTWQIESGERK